MRIKELLILSVTLLCAFGCTKPQPNGALYFPLDEDRSWLYRIKRITLDGESEIRQHLRIVDVNKSAEATEATKQSAGGKKHQYEIRDGAASRILPTEHGSLGSTSSTTTQLILPQNTEKGSQWESILTTTVLESSQPPWEKKFRITVPVPISYEILSTQSKITTPAGLFENCLYIKGRGSIVLHAGNYIGQTTVEVETEEWFAPNVGVVKIRREERTSSETLPSGTLFLELADWR